MVLKVDVEKKRVMGDESNLMWRVLSLETSNNWLNNGIKVIYECRQNAEGKVQWSVPKHGADQWNYFDSYDLIEGEFDMNEIDVNDLPNGYIPKVSTKKKLPT